MKAAPTAITLLCSLLAGSSPAQVPDAAPAPAAAVPEPAPIGQGPIGQPPAAKPASPLGNEIPILDPTNEVMQFNGKNFNISNNRLFQARFEKYLNAPEATSKDDTEYRAYVDRILTLLAPGSATPQNVDAAFKLLPKAGRYDIDARLCDSLADAVYSVWQSQRNQAHLTQANAALEEARRTQEWNLKVASDTPLITRQVPKQPATQPANAPVIAGVATKEDVGAAPHATRLTEAMAAIKANEVKREISVLQSKVEFQAMMVQFFLQRRFQHVLMSSRFYRALFTEGDTKLNLGKDMTDLFQKSTGMPPTVSILDSMANEALRDVREGTNAFRFLLEKNEMEGATKRLQETFMVGEYLPEIRLVPRDLKRQCLGFAQKSYQLISALEVKDYARAEQIVKDMKKVANDFDDSKPTAAIEGAKIQARTLLAKAKQAALANDKVELEKALTTAAQVWPGNPEFKEVSEKLFNQGDVIQKTLLDFDQLLGQKNFRQIWDDKFRFGAAVAYFPDRKEQMEKVMKDMEQIEAALREASARTRQSDYPGAWEVLERTFAQYPEDSKLNQQRADLTTRASDFVRTVKDAEEMERREQTGASLALFLKAQKLYPASDFAKQGIDRLARLVLPDPAP